MYSCRDAMEQMTEEREGALSGWARALYRVHVTVCPHCRRCRRQFEDTIGLSREILPEEVPASVETAAVDAFKARRGPRAGG